MLVAGKNTCRGQPSAWCQPPGDVETAGGEKFMEGYVMRCP